MLTAFLVAAAASLAATGAHGVFYRNSGVFGRALHRLQGNANDIALTFDDGPNPVATARILDVLRDESVHATFFLLGKHVERWPDLARRVADEGHTLGNHGYHHRTLHRRGRAYARVDLALGAQAIEAATGRRPRYFRAPHGYRAPWVSGFARHLGEQTVGWSRGVWDSDRPGANEIVRRTLGGARPGAIMLLHDGDGYDPLGDRTQTAEALPAIIRGLRERGYRPVSLPS